MNHQAHSFPSRPPDDFSGDYAKAVGLRDIIYFCRSSTPAALICAAVFVAIALLYVLVTPATYSATSTVIFDPPAGSIISTESRWLDSGIENATRIDSQVEVIKSANIASLVVRELSLTDDPDFNALDGDSARVSPQADAPIPQASGLNAETDAVPNGDERLNAAVRNATAMVAANIFVKRLGQSAVIEITYRARTPDKAAKIANKIAETYIGSELAAKSDAARRGSLWLRQRLDEIRTQAFDAQRDVEKFKGVGSGSASESQVKLAELESIAQTYRRLYESFLLKFTETVQKVSYPVADSRIVSLAAPPTGKSHPKSAVILAFAAVLGALTGVVGKLVSNAMDRSLRTPEQAELALGVASLGTLNMVEPDDVGGTVCSTAMIDENRSCISEFRAVKRSIDMRTPNKKSRCIGVVAYSPGEGATTVASHLAQLYALAGARTLLVDFCLKDASASRRFAPEAAAGVMQALSGTAPAASLIIRSSIPQLSILPAVEAQTVATPGDLIEAADGALKFAEIRQGFDVTIIDLPALSTSSDAHTAGPLLDGIVIVAEAGRTSIDALASEVGGFMASGTNVLGLLVNKIRARETHTLASFYRHAVSRLTNWPPLKLVISKTTQRLGGQNA